MEQLERSFERVTESDSNDDAGRRRLKQVEAEDETETETETVFTPNEYLPSNLGYQVVWRSWMDADDTLELLNSPLAISQVFSVALTDSESLRESALAPCGESESMGFNSTNCFAAPFATSLRLEGLRVTENFVFGVRALTRGDGAGPLSAPVVVRAKGSYSAADDNDDDDGEVDETETDVSETETSEGTSVEVLPPTETTTETEEPLPTAPPLLPPPMYEAERIGAVYEQINQPLNTPTQYGDGFGALGVDEETTEVVRETPYGGGYGGYGGGYPLIGGYGGT